LMKKLIKFFLNSITSRILQKLFLKPYSFEHNLIIEYINC
jgi:hypothetical protein